MLRQLFIGLWAMSPVLAEKCGVHMTYGEEVQTNAGFGGVVATRAPAAAFPILDLWVHVVAGSDDRRDGNITRAEVNHQVKIIQDLYQPVGITFRHDDTMTQWHVNKSWAGNSTDFDEMKIALHQGDYKTVNLYIRNITLKDYGGSCSHPWKDHRDIPDKARRLAQDGCVVATFSLDGSDHAFMNQGKTAVHEIGHWFGLWHPFEDGGIWDGPNMPDPCRLSNPDDNVTDTPKMRRTGIGACVETQDSCRGDNETDPIHNYMTYSSDACLDRFSPGQVARMYAIYEEFRKTGKPI